MSKEEDFFKENFPEYVTEKGEYLSPYWDLFRAGVICANFEQKEKLNNLSSVAEVRLANWLKYEQAYNETEELLDKQIEATYKLFKENKELKEKIAELDKLDEAKEIIKELLESCFGYNSKSVNYEIKAKAEQFLREIVSCQRFLDN